MSSSSSGNAPESGKRVILLSFCLSSAMAISMSGVLSSIPLLASSLDTSLRSASFAASVFGLPSVFFAPVAGLFIDRYGRRAVLLPGLILYCVGGLLCGLSTNITMLIAMRFVQGMGGCAVGILQTTLLADSFTGDKMRRLVGLNMAAFSITAALSPSIGGLLAQVSWRLPFLFPVLYCFLIPLAWNMKLAKPASDTTLREYCSGIAEVFKVRRTQALLLLTFLAWCLTFGAVLTSIPALADHFFKAPPSAIGLVFLFYSAAMAFASSRLGALLQRLSPRHVLLLGTLLQFIALFFAPLAPTLAILTVPVAAYGFAQGMIVPNVQAQLLQSVPTSQRGSLMALSSMLQRAGVVAGPPLCTTVLLWFGFSAPFYMGMGGVMIMAMLTFFFIPNEKIARAK